MYFTVSGLRYRLVKIEMTKNWLDDLSVFQNHADMEWKFSRSKLWMGYFDEGSTLPSPFNLIISPKSIYYAASFFKNFLSSCINKSRPLTRSKRRTSISSVKVRKESMVYCTCFFCNLFYWCPSFFHTIQYLVSYISSTILVNKSKLEKIKNTELILTRMYEILSACAQILYFKRITNDLAVLEAQLKDSLGYLNIYLSLQ